MIKIIENLNVIHFKKMEYLEKLYYDDDYVTNALEAYKWYNYWNNSIIVVQNTIDNKIVGFMNLFPIPKNIFKRIAIGQYNDKDLTYKDIVIPSDIDKEYNLFLSCIVIHHDYRNTVALNVLLKEYMTRYQQFSESGYNFKYVITDNVTKKGIKFSQSLNLKPYITSDHNSTICLGSYEDFIEGIKNKLSLRK